MIFKPEKIIKRIIKAVGTGQSVLVVGEWQEELITGIKEKQNILTVIARKPEGLTKQSSNVSENSQKIASSLPLLAMTNKKVFPFEDNLFTRIIADYNSSVFDDEHLFFNEARRLLLPTGMIIISANSRDGIIEKMMRVFKKDYIKEEGFKKINPKTLQDQIHDHGFLIDGYYGYPGGHLLMMAQIQNKEVSTLFSTDKQETIVN